jgi:hypothetical protein
LYPAGGFPNSIAVADFNGDHLPDVTIADQISNGEYVLLPTILWRGGNRNPRGD